MKKILCLLILAAIGISSCSLPAPIPPPATPTLTPTQFFPPTIPVVMTKPVTPTIGPIPSVTPIPGTRTATGTPFAATPTNEQPAASSTPIPSTATLAPSATQPPKPTSSQPLPTGTAPQNPEAILILQPGLGSILVASITVSGEADPTFEQNLVGKVTGENGLALVTKSTIIQAPAGKRGAFKLTLPFTVSKEQPGRVAVYSISPKDGGLVHFSSVDVTLKPGGSASLKSSSAASEVLVITNPLVAAAVSGGKLVIQGWSGPVFENSLSLVLCGEGGSGGKSDPFCGTTDNVLARGNAIIKTLDVGKPGPFSAELTYKVTKTTGARLAVYFTSPRDGGLLHLASVPVRLEP